MTQLSCSGHAFYEQAFPMFGVILGDDIDQNLGTWEPLVLGNMM